MKNFGEERLKNVLGSDKNQNPEKMKKIIKSEVFYILKDYFELDSDDLSVNIDMENNKYSVKILFVSNTIKLANTF